MGKQCGYDWAATTMWWTGRSPFFMPYCTDSQLKQNKMVAQKKTVVVTGKLRLLVLYTQLIRRGQRSLGPSCRRKVPSRR